MDTRHLERLEQQVRPEPIRRKVPVPVAKTKVKHSLKVLDRLIRRTVDQLRICEQEPEQTFLRTGITFLQQFRFQLVGEFAKVPTWVNKQ